MQAAGGLVDLAIKLAARMEGGQDDFKRRFALVFGVRINRDAAAIIGNAERAVFIERHLDTVGMACDGLIHGVVEDFGRQMVQRPVISAADIHPWTSTDGFEAFEDLDIVCGIIPARAGGFVKKPGFFGFAFGGCHTGLISERAYVVPAIGGIPHNYVLYMR